jgi:hypothetical protein
MGFLCWKAADILVLWKYIGECRTYRVALDHWQRGMNSDNSLKGDDMRHYYKIICCLHFLNIPTMLQYSPIEVTMLSQRKCQLDGGLSKTINTATLVMARAVIGHEQDLSLLSKSSGVLIDFRVKLLRASSCLQESSCIRRGCCPDRVLPSIRVWSDFGFREYVA